MAVIKTDELTRWANNIEGLNQEAVDALNDLQNTVNRISDGYKCVSSQATIESMASDILNASSCHENPALQNSLANVIEFANQV